MLINMAELAGVWLALMLSVFTASFHSKSFFFYSLTDKSEVNSDVPDDLPSFLSQSRVYVVSKNRAEGSAFMIS